MRLRNAVTSAAAALLLALAVPASAHAASGEFRYQFGPGYTSSLEDPPSGVCIDIPEATIDNPAYAPQNFTDSTATVFRDLGCDGDVYYVMPPGMVRGQRLIVRSVIFS
ncbi:hypothetical protein [Streptacidiphilus fuscans]|uniref:Uncharacterized protein n=1 Tax=Streptacidiphilus fuscans TaxID=2789292 RepID=A0A931B9M7_9ACTN|nr:hypothetical protein [Streptacidiphilus fuscans]MBF9072611.1 hypothetical protein [Streptacidiphilus fuscans]